MRTSVAILFLLALVCESFAKSDNLQIHVFNVGQADSQLIGINPARRFAFCAALA